MAGTLLIPSCNYYRFHHRLSFFSLMEEHRLNEQSDEIVTVLGRLPKLSDSDIYSNWNFSESFSVDFEENSWLASLLI